MISSLIIMGFLSGYAVFSALVMANAVDPDFRAPGLERILGDKDK